jgi:hypothetical protein
MEAATVAALAAMVPPSGLATASQHPNQLASVPCTPSTLAGLESSAAVVVAAAQQQGPEAGLALPAPFPALHGRHASVSGSSSGGGSVQPSRRSRGARGGSHNRGGGGGGGGGGGNNGSSAANASNSAGDGTQGPGGSAGFSASLMHHIQAIRENPPQGGSRFDPNYHLQQQQLAGWGLGACRCR